MTDQTIPLTKRCTKCGEEKALSEFYKSKRAKCGLQSDCKSCNKVTCAAWYKANLEKAKSSRAAWYKANLEMEKVRCAAWHKANLEKAKSSRAAWYKANLEKVKCATAAWKKANPEKVKAAASKCIERLDTSYIAITLRLPVKECPPELIKLKRVQLQITRELRSQK